MGFLLVQALGGLAAGSVLFLVASGLSLIFGVTRIVNFAHGSFTMLGAYLAWSLTERLGQAGWPGGAAGFLLAALAAALVVGLLGALMERLLLRRLYRSPELFPLLATFGVVLVLQDATLALWGPEDLLGRRPPGLSGTVVLLGWPFPVYDLVLIALGPLVLGLLWLLLHRSRWGTRVRAATQDREMTAILGIDQNRLFCGVLMLGSALAGLGGALQVPREALTLHMGLSTVVEAFAVVVIGGMGSIPGAFLAALLIGELQAFGILLFPHITLVLVFLVMAAVLVIRPHGLLGRATGAGRSGEGGVAEPLRPAGPVATTLGLALIAALATAPFWTGDYGLIVLTDLAILALFAAGLHFLIGVAGLISFGHAAYFGLGAYGAALATHHLALPMMPALAAGMLAAAAGATLFGWFCVRRSGVYLAMLSLAGAEITGSAAMQWTDVTGGDNGILGIWPDSWAASRAGFYWLTLVLATTGVLALRRLAFAPFGTALRAARDSERRATSIGIPVRRLHWLCFIVAGTAAGLAGGLQTFATGSVFPTVLGVTTSVDGLVMVLLGGLGSLAGPLVGAAAFQGLKGEIMRETDLWQLWLGLTIIALVLACPRGLTGFARDLTGWWRTGGWQTDGWPTGGGR
jgi:branched-chain amino acid transport system permease protein